MPNTKNTEAKTVTSFEAELHLYGAQSSEDLLARGDHPKPKRVRPRETGFAQKKREAKELQREVPRLVEKLNTNENRGFSGLSQLGIQVTLAASELGSLASAPGFGKSKSSSRKKAQKKVEASKASSPKKRRNRK